MKVLHICNWYPDSDIPYRALFIKRHIDSLRDYCINDVIHFEVIKSTFFGYQFSKKNNLTKVIVKVPFTFWKLNEIICYIWLAFNFIYKKKHKEYDIINFHIAYPLLTYWHRIKSKINIPIVITEHWSAYHFNFGVKKELHRVRKIFQQNIPLIVVSEALYSDIKKFSGVESKHSVIPNIVDSGIFYPGKEPRQNILLMVGTWKKPKLPFLAMEAFVEFHKTNPKYELVIIGEGFLFQKMQKWVETKSVKREIKLIGNSNPEEIANYMRTAMAFLHPSEYETFSVVCAEAKACGLPILASDRGGIKEVISDQGILIDNKLEQWEEGIERIVKFPVKSPVPNPFNHADVGKRYYSALLDIISKN